MGIFGVNIRGSAVANLMNPADIASAYQGGLQFGQQLRERKRMEDERAQLRNLAPQIMQGDPAAFSQAAAINPEAATTYQSAGDSQYRRVTNVAKMMRDAINTGNPTAKQRAFQTIRPFLSQMAGGRPVPEQWDDSLLPGFEQFENRISMAAGQQDQQRNLSVSPGSAIVNPATGEVVYERPFAPQQQSFEFNGPDGRPRRYTFNTRTGQYEEATLGAAQPVSAPPPAEASQRLNAIVQTLQQQGLSPEQIQAAMPVFEQAVLAPPGGPSMGGAPLVGRSPEEQAALTTGAQEAARLQYLPQTEQIKADAAVRQAADTATAKGRAEATLEAQQNLPRVLQESNNTIRLIDQALNHPGRVVATGASSRLDPRNFIPGTEARDFQALLDQIKGGTFLQAFQSLKGGGAITEVEGRKAEQAIARLQTDQTEEGFANSLRELRQIAVDAIGRAQKKAQGPTGNTGRKVIRTGTLNGRKVVQYSDGATDYAD